MIFHIIYLLMEKGFEWVKSFLQLTYEKYRNSSTKCSLMLKRAIGGNKAILECNVCIDYVYVWAHSPEEIGVLGFHEFPVRCVRFTLELATKWAQTHTSMLNQWWDTVFCGF